ncbi:MAG TPA: M20/M25/M40 family metallo-hydrolase [Polyangiaceae bacterium]
MRPRLACALGTLGAALLASCADDPPPPVVAPPPIAAIVRPDEGHLTEIRQLTFGGENGATRWSWNSDQVALQARADARACAHVSRVSLTDPPGRFPLGEGESPSFLPGDRDLVYASSPSCAKHRGHAEGVFLDASLDVFRARADGSAPTRLTASPGYDGEPSVCGKTGAIVFTSMREGDPDLYRMDADGGHVERITATTGYDGGAVFDAGCAHLAWYAWHPKGKALDEYRTQLAEGTLHPTTLELWIANADGTDARQVTYLDARSWAPSWYPSEARLLFASTFGGEAARDVDLWAIDLDGTNLERVTTAPGPDDAPAFSPDGKSIAFTSARATELGKTDTNVFVARWAGGWRHVEEQPADHLMGDSAWLADRAREGRGVGSKGLEDAGAYLERSFQAFGLAPGGSEEFRQPFDVTTQVTGQATLEVAGVPVGPADVRPLGMSASMAVEGPLVFIGADSDYEKVGVKGKVVVVRRSGSPRHAAWLARDRGAVGFIAVTEAATLPEPAPDTGESIPAVIASSRAMSGFLSLVLRGVHPQARLAVTLAPEMGKAFNVVARWKATASDDQKLPGVVVVGAHYDSIGPGSPGADDNASGTAALLQVARSLGEKKPALRRDIVLVGFSGEEQGAAGAAAFARKPPGGLATKDIVAMIDLDMVGRMRDDTLQVFGSDTASAWPELLAGACNAAGVDCIPATGGLGGADRGPFFEAGIPAVHFFTGVHGDRHKPADTPDKLNATGMAQVARIAEHLSRDLAVLPARPEFVRTATPPGEGDVRGMGASLGTIPDPAPPPNGQKGMLLAGVRPGGPADAAGLRKGDVIVRLGGHVVGGTDDVKFVMTQSRPGAHIKAVVLRDGKELSVDVTLDVPPKR